MKYLVMECHLSYAVVLAEDGRFLTVANRRYQVGQRVSEVFALQPPQENNVAAFPTAKPAKRTLNRWAASLAAVAACLMLAAGSFLYLERLPYASVYMAINPEVRIDVNRSDRVVGLEGVNQDGLDLIDGYQYRRKELDVVMDELVDLAIRDGYLHEGGKVTLTLDSEDDQWEVTHSGQLDRRLRERLTEKLSVTIEIRQLPEEAPPPQRSEPPSSQPAEENIQVVIPVGPGSGYHSSGQPAASSSSPAYQNQSGNAYGDSPYSGVSGDPAYSRPSGSGDSGYNGTSGDSAYSQPSGSGDSGYNDTSGDSAYSRPSNSGDSGYGGSSDDAGQSGYRSGNDDGSNYGSEDDDDD